MAVVKTYVVPKCVFPRLDRTSVLNLLQAIENKKFLAKKPQKRVHVNERIVSIPGDGNMLSYGRCFRRKAAVCNRL